MALYDALRDALAAGAADCLDMRRALLRQPGVTLQRTKARGRGRRRQRCDLIAYREPGGPRRLTYWVCVWSRKTWASDAALTPQEAEARYRTWAEWPSWFRKPTLLREVEG